MASRWQALRSRAGRVFRRLLRTRDPGALIEELLGDLRPEPGQRLVFVQTGCGASTLALAGVARRTGARVYACDLEPKKFDELRENACDDLAGVTFLAGDSLTSLAQISSRHERVDFALFDSAPSATRTLREFLQLEPRFGPGSRVLIDDAALPGAQLLLGPRRKGRLVVPYLLASPFWSVSAHPRTGDSMVSAVLDAVGARSDESYEDPRYVDLWRAGRERPLRPVPAV